MEFVTKTVAVVRSIGTHSAFCGRDAVADVQSHSVLELKQRAGCGIVIRQKDVLRWCTVFVYRGQVGKWW